MNGISLDWAILDQPNQLFTEKQACNFLKQLLDGVNEAHKKGIIHRCIEPKNIVLYEEDKVKLIDFGVEKSSKNNNLHAITGTPYYMAPEVLEGR